MNIIEHDIATFRDSERTMTIDRAIEILQQIKSLGISGNTLVEVYDDDNSRYTDVMSIALTKLTSHESKEVVGFKVRFDSCN